MDLQKHELDVLREQADVISRSGLVKQSRPETILTIALKGRELGLPPMQAIAHVHVIEGKPTLSAELMRALVFRAGHEIWFEESTNERCVIVGKRKGSERENRVEWTMADARQAGVANKKNWKDYPRAMLVARATSELCRLVFPDCTGGMSYTPEELGGEVIVDGDGEVRYIEEPKVEVTAEALPPVERPAAPSMPPRETMYAAFHARLGEYNDGNGVPEEDYRAAMQEIYGVDSIKDLESEKLRGLINRIRTADGMEAFMDKATDYWNRQAAAEQDEQVEAVAALLRDRDGAA